MTFFVTLFLCIIGCGLVHACIAENDFEKFAAEHRCSLTGRQRFKTGIRRSIVPLDEWRCEDGIVIWRPAP